MEENHRHPANRHQEMLQVSALIELLIEKGIVTKDELMGKIEKSRAKIGR